MGRIASDVLAKLTVRVPRGNQAYWEIIRELRTFTLSDIDSRCFVRRDTIGDYVRRLVKAGFVAIEGMCGDAVMYRLEIDQPDAPRVRRDGSIANEIGVGQDRMWRSMKMLKTFTAEELAASASLGPETVTVGTAKEYLKHLQRAGYLTIVVAATPGYRSGTGNPARYRLRPDMITGPLAPQVQRTDWVWDPNRKAVMGPEAKP